MKWMKIDYIKQHSRIDYDCEDALLALYASDAEKTVLNLLNRTFPDLLLSYGSVPEPVVHATLMLVEVSYNHRSPDSMTSLYLVPYSFDLLLKPYMRLHGELPEVQRLTLGGKTKVAFTAVLPEGLTMEDTPFTLEVYNAENSDKKTVLNKSECIFRSEDEYVAIIDSSAIGEGEVMLRLILDLPDNDFPAGYNRQPVLINPNLEVVR